MNTMPMIRIFSLVIVSLMIKHISGCNEDSDCGSHGICSLLKSANELSCFCAPGFKGSNCEIKTCKSDCNKHGSCNESTGECICIKGYGGKHCENVECTNDCNENGICVDEKECYCKEGWTGVDCSTPTCHLGKYIPEKCSGQGRCVNAICVCQQGYSGETCEQNKCMNDCHNRGSCVCGNHDVCSCSCFNGFRGDECELLSCDIPDCSGHGVCSKLGSCNCESGYTGSGCDVKVCPDDCNGNGKCINGVCKCDSSHRGGSCNIEMCPFDCYYEYGQGKCTKTGCKCSNGFEGDACSKEIGSSLPENFDQFGVKQGDVIGSSIVQSMNSIAVDGNPSHVCGNDCFGVCRGNNECHLSPFEEMIPHAINGVTYLKPVEYDSKKDLEFLKTESSRLGTTISKLLNDLTVYSENKDKESDANATNIHIPEEILDVQGTKEKLTSSQRKCLWGCVASCMNECASSIRSLSAEDRKPIQLAFEEKNGFSLI